MGYLLERVYYLDNPASVVRQVQARRMVWNERILLLASPQSNAKVKTAWIYTYIYMPCLVKHRESHFYHSVGAFAKLLKTIISFVMSVCPPALLSIFVCPHRTTWFLLDRFSWNFVFEDFFEILWRNFRCH